MEGPAIHLVMTESLIIFEAISYLPTSTGLSGRMTIILPFFFLYPLFLVRICEVGVIVILFFHQVDVAASGPASLSGHIRQAVACTCADPYSKRETYTMVYKTVKDSAGKHPAESSSLKNEGCLIVIIHLQTPCRQPPGDIS